MSKKLLAAGGGALVVVAALAGYIWFSGGSGEPSTEVTAPPIETATTRPATTTATTLDSATSTSLAGTSVTYAIVKEESTVSFALEEDLRGTRTSVVGTTNELAAEILVDFADPPNSQVGQVVINARTLATDSSFRDRAIRGEILESASDEFEFITFTPTAHDGLSSAMSDGATFTVTGDLTIRDISRSVTFEVILVSITEGRLEGSATAEVLRSHFELNIPSVPQVANVTEEVQLTIEFVAEAV